MNRRGHVRGEGPFVELVVVPHSAELQAAEDALSLALVAMVGRTRPVVSPAMVRDHLRASFGINGGAISVLRHVPEDLIVRFSHREDLKMVLATPPPSEAAPFTLRWRRWTRFANASTGAFTYKVLVRIKGVPVQALSAAVVQLLMCPG